jgi:centromere/kinetochore protein ZW10
LEKLANKGKKDLNGNSPLMTTPVSPNVSSSSPAISSNSPVVGFKPHSPSSPHSAGKLVENRPPNLSLPAPSKENYVVSTRMKGILTVVRETLHEAKEFADSRILPPTSESSSLPGSSLFQASASILDLYRALYPVAFSGLLQSLEGPMRYSNNCLYLSVEIEVLAKELCGPGVETVKQRLGECEHALKLSSDSWYGDAIVSFVPTIWSSL